MQMSASKSTRKNVSRKQIELSEYSTSIDTPDSHGYLQLSPENCEIV